MNAIEKVDVDVDDPAVAAVAAPNVANTGDTEYE
jgi:hypothetical protein